MMKCRWPPRMGEYGGDFEQIYEKKSQLFAVTPPQNEVLDGWRNHQRNSEITQKREKIICQIFQICWKPKWQKMQQMLVFWEGCFAVPVAQGQNTRFIFCPF